MMGLGNMMKSTVNTMTQKAVILTMFSFAFLFETGHIKFFIFIFL